MQKGYKIHIKGLVQGVGFRPFIYNLACDMKLTGYVDNSTEGVDIHLNCNKNKLDEFISDIYTKKPQVAIIESMDVKECDISHTDRFEIMPSVYIDGDITRISADIAVCDKCLEDFNSQYNRINYPLVNCTNCGPRFSIIKSIPYDRENTTMEVFEMCNECGYEYENPVDRRFHTQPVSCNNCGPRYSSGLENEYLTIVQNAVATLQAGGILAMKGVGGYVWIADALNTNAVEKLRGIKHRYVKPFAIMCADNNWIREYVNIDQTEYSALISWRRPIVILREKEKLNRALNGNLTTLGVMFPYLPFHYDLFNKGGMKALVVTSANAPSQPMVIDNDQAHQFVLNHSDYFIEHNREIHNRVDDSVVRVVNNDIQILRRARGYVPEPLINIDNVEGGIAFGAHITSAFAIGRNNQILLSQYIGELENIDAQLSFEQALIRFTHLFNFTPRYVVADSHPEYFSTKLAEKYAADNNLPIYKIQHHHAHAVAVMAEHKITDQVIAICLDGAGLGTDGMSWGGEILKCSRTDFNRLDHLSYAPLPGADAASKECWRMAIAYLKGVYNEDIYNILPRLNLSNNISDSKIDQILSLMQSPLQKQFTSSVGRLFDGVAAILGICYENTFQSEGAILLEHKALSYAENNEEVEHYPINMNNFHYKDLVKGIVEDLLRGETIEKIAYKFHKSLSCLISTIAANHALNHNISKIVLCGGVFQNKLLSEMIIKEIRNNSLEVYYSNMFPNNDGALAVGQLAAVASLNKLKDYA